MLETFILFEDKVGEQLHAACCAAARRGVQVDMMVDGFGSPRPVAGVHRAADRGGRQSARVRSGQAHVRPAHSMCFAACTARSWWSTARLPSSAASTTRPTTWWTSVPRPSRTMRSSSRARWSRDIHRFVLHAIAVGGKRAAAGAGRRLRAAACRRRGPRPASARLHVRDARQPPPHQRHRAALPRRHPQRAAPRGDRQRLFLPRLPAAPGNAPGGAARRRRTADPAGRARHADRQGGGEHAATTTCCAPACASTNTASGRCTARWRWWTTMVHGGLEQPRSAEPVAEPGGQRRRARPRLQQGAARASGRI